MDIEWRRSSVCDAGECAEVWPGSTTTWLRDSTQPEVVLMVSLGDFAAFLADAKSGRWDRPGREG